MSSVITYTECPTNMETHSNTFELIFLFLKTTYICQKVTPDLKSLGRKLSDGTLKPRKMKLEVFFQIIPINIYSNSSYKPHGYYFFNCLSFKVHTTEMKECH